MRTVFRTLQLFSLCFFSGVSSASITSLGEGQPLQDTGLGISSDGRVVFGASVTPLTALPDQEFTGGTQAWRWVQDTRESLGPFVPVTAANNGSVIVGNASLVRAGETDTPAYWTEAGGLAYLPDFQGLSWQATSMSQDGLVVIGSTGERILDPTEPESRIALRWSVDGLIDIGSLGGNITVARHVSENGSVIAGHGLTENLNFVPESASARSSDGYFFGGDGFSIFRWTAETGMQNLGNLGGASAGLGGMSYDGSALVGYSSLPESDAVHAFRWTQQAGMISLGTLGGNYSSATMVSADGTVVSGVSRLDEERLHAFRWTASQGMQSLTPSVAFSRPIAISANGASIVGIQGNSGSISYGPDSIYGQSPFSPDSQSPTDSQVVSIIAPQGDGFYWSEQQGLMSISQWAGVTNSDYENFTPTGLSDGGNVVVGYARNTQSGLWESWLAKRDAMINPEQLMASISNSRQLFGAASSMVSLVMNGSHHRPLAYSAFSAEDSRGCYWINADQSRVSEGGRARQGLYEMGACTYVNGYLLGASVGGGRFEQDLPINSKQEVDGNYLVVELSRRMQDYPLLLSGTVMHGRWDLDLQRGYQTFSGADASRGSTNSESTVMRLRADLVDAVSGHGITLTPWLSYAYYDVKVDAFNETTGGFPARFNSQKERFEEARLGVLARTQVTQRLQASLGLEQVNVLSGDVPDVTVEIAGVSSLTIPGYQPKKSWSRLGIDLDFLVSSHSKISLSGHLATSGMDATRSVSLGFHAGF